MMLASLQELIDGKIAPHHFHARARGAEVVIDSVRLEIMAFVLGKTEFEPVKLT